VELFKRDAAPHDNLNASQAGDTPEETSVSDPETIVEFEVRVRNVLGSRAVPAAEAIANVGMQPCESSLHLWSLRRQFAD
jgi:hypothetical protein